MRAQSRLRTTLDAGLQHMVQTILDQRLKGLMARDARNGAVLIVDHQRNEVLAWVNSGVYLADVPASWIDAVTTPRQPGSTLKPLLYALAGVRLPAEAGMALYVPRGQRARLVPAVRREGRFVLLPGPSDGGARRTGKPLLKFHTAPMPRAQPRPPRAQPHPQAHPLGAPDVPGLPRP